MARENIAPTRSNLILVKERLSTAREGWELLDQKREILVMELMRTVERVKLLEKGLDERVATAYPAMKRLLVTVGREKAERMSRGIQYQYEILERREKVAGMNLPGLEARLPEPELKYSPASSYVECDETVIEFFALLRLLSEMAAVRTTAWRLAREVRKTQRRVNALEKVVIPTARDTKRYIEDSLEERERESFFTGKLLKRRHGRS